MRRATFTAGLPGQFRQRHAVRSVGAAVLAALAAIATCATLAGCGADAVLGPGPLPSGTWGGIQGNLVVYADSATLDLPCAVGRIPGPLVTDADGRFDTVGFWAPQAGPIGPGGLTWDIARFTGQRAGDRLQVNVQVSGGAAIGPLEFRRGVVGEFPRCV